MIINIFDEYFNTDYVVHVTKIKSRKVNDDEANNEWEFYFDVITERGLRFRINAAFLSDNVFKQEDAYKKIEEERKKFLKRG